MHLIDLLQGIICKHKFLKVEDRNVVTNICQCLRITDNTGLINQYLMQQIDMEAGVVYLTNKYGILVSKLQDKLYDYKADKFVVLGDKTDEGYKWTKQGKEDWLRSTDSEFLAKRGTLVSVEQLLGVLKDLSTIVFRRTLKLEQLAINYRRETEADKKTCE